MKTEKRSIFLVALALAMTQVPQVAAGQGKGGGKDQSKPEHVAKPGEAGKPGKVTKSVGKTNDKAYDKAVNNAAKPMKGYVNKIDDKAPKYDASKVRTEKIKGDKVKFVYYVSPANMPSYVVRYAKTKKPKNVIVAVAVSQAYARGNGENFLIDEYGNAIRIKNKKGQQLVFLDDRSAQDLGRWRVGVVDYQPRDNAPSFCRSGEGHPVWGRQWCIDKGFGLGYSSDYRWGSTNNPGDVVFVPNRLTGNSLIGDALAGVLGTNTFNRLALHAVTLGLVEPLVGRWVSQPTGPQMLLVNSGRLPVAEFEDVNRDNRADNMLVALRPWY